MMQNRHFKTIYIKSLDHSFRQFIPVSYGSRGKSYTCSSLDQYCTHIFSFFYQKVLLTHNSLGLMISVDRKDQPRFRRGLAASSTSTPVPRTSGNHVHESVPLSITNQMPSSSLPAPSLAKTGDRLKGSLFCFKNFIKLH